MKSNNGMGECRDMNFRWMSHLQFIARFCRATLSRDKIASVNKN